MLPGSDDSKYAAHGAVVRRRYASNRAGCDSGSSTESTRSMRRLRSVRSTKLPFNHEAEAERRTHSVERERTCDVRCQLAPWHRAYEVDQV